MDAQCFAPKTGKRTTHLFLPLLLDTALEAPADKSGKEKQQKASRLKGRSYGN